MMNTKTPPPPPPNSPPPASGIGIGYNNVHDGEFFNRDQQELLWLAERSLIQHKLSKEYYGFRAYWFHYLPLLVITTITTVLGFYSGGMQSDDANSDSVNKASLSDLSAEKRYIMSITLGVLGALSSSLTALERWTNYGAQKDMHGMTELALQRIVNSLRFEKHRSEEVKKQAAVYTQVEDMCTSEVPPKILRAFNDLDVVVKNTRDYEFQILHGRFNNFLWKKLTGQGKMGSLLSMWPWRIHDVDMKKVKENIDEEYENFKRPPRTAMARSVSPAKSALEMENATTVAGDSSMDELHTRMERGDGESGGLTLPLLGKE